MATTRKSRSSSALLFAALAFLGPACASHPIPDFDTPLLCRTHGAVESSLYLIGDAGEPKLPDPKAQAPDALIDPVLTAMASDIAASVAQLGTENTTVLYLGDNVYPAGLPVVGDPDRARAERVLEAQITAAGEARALFILGNHDWDQAGKGGLERASAQHAYLKDRAPNVSIHPEAACPGPDFLDLGEHLRIVFFDFWSAVYQIENPGGAMAHCTPPAGKGELIPEVTELIRGAGERRVIFAVHPPLITAGGHGGYFPWKEHLFPFRVFNRHLWIPVPILGSIFPIARLLGATKTDIMNTTYATYARAAFSIFEPGVPALVAAGHEHSLQVHVGPQGVVHAVSGAGSSVKVDYVRHLHSQLMAVAAPGYMRLDVYDENLMRLDVMALDAEGERHRVYSTCVP